MTNKIIKSALILMAIFVASCSNDDDATPVPVNEEEVITTLTATLTPVGGGAPVILQSRDLDGDGPNPPVVTNGTLTAGTTYNAAIVLLNETENPPENITLEVIEEADEHQFLFFTSGSLNVTITYDDFDSNGNPLGTQFTVDAGNASSGAFRIVLKHEPTKPNDGTLAGAGGETDIDVTFDVTIQ